MGELTDSVRDDLRALGDRRKSEFDSERHDLDETRRLLYMVLLGGCFTERWYNLAGTLTNALAHHSKMVPAEVTMAHLSAIARSRSIESDDEGRDEAHAWVLSLIDKITAQLDDAPDAMP